MNLINFRSDNHVHTSLCGHASGSMEEYVLAAIGKNLERIVFLEHMEEGINYFEKTWLSEEEFDFYFKEGKRLQQKYRKGISIGLGVEVGYNPACRDILKQRLAQRDWDVIGVSYHYAHHPDFPFALNLVSSKQENRINIEKAGHDGLLSEYYDKLIEAVQFLPGTMLCHLDAGLRHQPGLVHNASHLAQIDCLLEKVRSKGMCIEINTSGFNYRDCPYPAPFIIKKATELSIPLAGSSDSHKPEDVGRHFDKLESYVSLCLNRA